MRIALNNAKLKFYIGDVRNYVGSRLCGRLLAQGHAVRPAVREARGMPDEVAVGTLDAATDWAVALAGCDAVVHLAARVHVMADPAAG